MANKVGVSLGIDEEYILRASQKIGLEQAFDHADVWEQLDV